MSLGALPADVEHCCKLAGELWETDRRYLYSGYSSRELRDKRDKLLNDLREALNNLGETRTA